MINLNLKNSKFDCNLFKILMQYRKIEKNVLFGKYLKNIESNIYFKNCGSVENTDIKNNNYENKNFEIDLNIENKIIKNRNTENSNIEDENEIFFYLKINTNVEIF
jgi:hypothetical protein